VTEITELAKSRGPGEFSQLMTYEPKVDELRGVDRVLWNSEKISSIAAQWGLSTEETMENIRIRGECKRRVVAESVRRADPSLLGARFVAAANAKYWSLVESGLAGDVLLSEWTSWLAGGW
jgi:hypothetical protein